MIKVASYNIRKSVGLDRQRRPGRILDVINEINADIIALQEVDRRIGTRQTTLPRAMIAAETDLKIIDIATRPDSIGWHGNALLVRKDIDVLSLRRHDIPVLEPRGAISADLVVRGARLRVVGMHLGLLNRFRKQQIRALGQQILNLDRPMATLIMGDLNEWRPKGSLSEFGPDFTVTTPGPSFHSARPVAALDRIILHKDLELLDGKVHASSLARIASDHLPIWADIRKPV